MAGDPALARESEVPAGAILSVSALNRSVRDLLEHRLPLAWVAGEISNFLQARSGHLYFSLKDSAAQVRCVMFRSRGMLLDWEPRDGMQVEVRALVTLYEARGEFQLNVEFMRPAGLGALYEAFLRLRDKLEREGLFDPLAKRPLPVYPRAIGVVTSKAAAALRDVLTTLRRRNPAIPVIVYPSAVQGEAAPAEIVEALAAAGRRAECDVLILCRGGGSIEDLRAFNDERVARAVRASSIPVVVGVGHETDFTIADFAADVRAPTPTAAAELASPPRDELLARIGILVGRLRRSVERDLETRMQAVDHLSRRLIHPGRRLQAQGALVVQLSTRLGQAVARTLDREGWTVRGLIERSRRHLPPLAMLSLRTGQLGERLAAASGRQLAERTARIDALARSLSHLDPRAVLERGYSIVRGETGRIVRRSAEVASGDRVDITFAEGTASARVERSE
ncbi:MAG TPA: exodeoxyribonuclease VII large subunit [Burkholderiales bacterium]|nr:exodeoxyribonuclease VII large subunit [Burkholderiales bacterium]